MLDVPAWGRWQELIEERLRSAGHRTLIEFARAHPIDTVPELARRLDPSLGGIQVEMVLGDEAKRLGCMEPVARDVLARLLREMLPDGWESPTTFNWIRVVTPWLNFMSSWFGFLFIGKYADRAIAYPIADGLVCARPPVGWLPASAGDLFLVRAFEDRWPPHFGNSALVAGRGTLPGDVAWSVLEEIWGKVDYWSAENAHDGARAHPPQVVQLLAAHWVHTELRTGGFTQVFHSCTGILAPLAPAGLAALGLTELADCLGRAIAAFSGAEEFPKDPHQRRRCVPDRFAAADDIGRELRQADEEARTWIAAHPGAFKVAADRYALDVIEQRLATHGTDDPYVRRAVERQLVPVTGASRPREAVDESQPAPAPRMPPID